MEITWYGHSCFRITDRGQAAVVCDPYDSEHVGYQPLKLKADIVTVSHESPSHSYLKGVKSDPYVITGPGEYEIGGVFITGVQTNGYTKQTSEEPRNTLYVFDYNGLAVAHLGDLNHVPSQTEIEALGNVHIALVPVGGGGGLSATKAIEVISMLEPGIVIPMHYSIPGINSSLKLNSVSKFLKEMGNANVDPQPSLRITPGSMPQETHVVVLNCERE